MSVYVMAEVWAHCEQKGHRLLCMIALADYCNDEGVCWPGNDALAKRIRATKRGAQKIIDGLIRAGEIELLGKKGSGRGHRAQLLLAKYIRLKGERRDTERVNGDAIKGERRRKPIIMKEPSVKPSVEPSEEPETVVVKRVYEHWRRARGKTNARYNRMSDKRRDKIRIRLQEFSEEDLVAAIDAVALDPWEDRHLHDDLAVIFRSQEQVERFLAFAEANPVTGQAAPVDDRPVERYWTLWQSGHEDEDPVGVFPSELEAHRHAEALGIKAAIYPMARYVNGDEAS